MKRFIVSLFMTGMLLSLFTGISFANQHRPYYSISGLGVFQDNVLTKKGRLNMDTGWGVVGAVGVPVYKRFDVELEYAYRAVGPDRLRNAYVGGNWDTHSIMANAYVKNSYHHDKITPYIGGGFGVAFHNFDVDAGTPWRGNTAVMAYQGMVGTYLDFGWVTKFKVGYRVFATNDGNYSGTDVGYLNHSVEVGFRF